MYHVSIMGFLYLAILRFKYDRTFHSRYFDEFSTRSGQDGQREPGLNGRRLPSKANHFEPYHRFNLRHLHEVEASSNDETDRREFENPWDSQYD